MRLSRSTSTAVRREPDPRQLSEALRGPGTDTRCWVEWGTVASIRDVDSSPDFEDPRAVVVTPESVDVDVVFGPNESPMTCRYGIGSGGLVSDLAPIRPGDLVLVALPGGEVGGVGVVLGIFSGASSPLPLDPDRFPYFQNDRRLVHARGVPIDFRTDGGARALLEEGRATVSAPERATTESPDVRLGAADAPEQLVKGTTYRTQEAAKNQAEVAALTTLVAAFATWAGDPATPAFAAAFPGTATLLTAIGAGASSVLGAIQSFEAQSATYLSQVSRTK